MTWPEHDRCAVRQPGDEDIALHGMGENYLRTGSVEGAVACLRRALEMFQRLGMPAAGQVTQRLAEIT